jgi:hypothetical protein
MACRRGVWRAPAAQVKRSSSSVLQAKKPRLALRARRPSSRNLARRHTQRPEAAGLAASLKANCRKSFCRRVLR